MIASCPITDTHIREMIAKCFYNKPENAAYDLTSGELIVGAQIMTGWRIVTKGKRARLEFKIGETP